MWLQILQILILLLLYQGTLLVFTCLIRYLQMWRKNPFPPPSHHRTARRTPLEIRGKETQQDKEIITPKRQFQSRYKNTAIIILWSKLSTSRPAWNGARAERDEKNYSDVWKRDEGSEDARDGHWLGVSFSWHGNSCRSTNQSEGAWLLPRAVRDVGKALLNLDHGINNKSGLGQAGK